MRVGFAWPREAAVVEVVSSTADRRRPRQDWRAHDETPKCANACGVVDVAAVASGSGATAPACNRHQKANPGRTRSRQPQPRSPLDAVRAFDQPGPVVDDGGHHRRRAVPEVAGRRGHRMPVTDHLAARLLASPRGPAAGPDLRMGLGPGLLLTLPMHAPQMRLTHTSVTGRSPPANPEPTSGGDHATGQPPRTPGTNQSPRWSRWASPSVP